MHGSDWFIYQCQSILNIHKYFLNRKNYSVHFLLRRNTGSRTWDTRLRSWTKMLRKMHVVCLILEYFPLKPGSLEILPPLPQKTELKCGRNIFAPAQTTLTWAEWGEGSPWCQIRGVSFLWVRKCKNYVKSLQITLQLLMSDSRPTDQELSRISREIRHLEAGSSTEL